MMAVARLGRVPSTVRRPQAVISARLFAITGRFACSALNIGPSTFGRLGGTWIRTPRSNAYSTCAVPVGAFQSTIWTSPNRSTSRSLSPTRSMMAWKPSSAAMPCWMLLMTASSLVRCSS